MKTFNISKDTQHTVWFRSFYKVEASTKEEALQKFLEDPESYFEVWEMDNNSIEDVISPYAEYLEIDGEEFEI